MRSDRHESLQTANTLLYRQPNTPTILQDIKPFGKRALGQRAVADHGGAGDGWVEIILAGIGFIFRQRGDLALHILLGHFDQEIGEEAIAGAQHIKPQHGGAAECAQGFFGDGAVILVDIRFGVDKDNLRAGRCG